MLKKLLKYDFIWINKFMSIYYIITLIICLLTRIMSNFNTSFVGNIIYLILRGCAISCFASILINCVIRIWARFVRTTYKDESYLIHTLPISKNTLYNSKIVGAILSILLGLVVIFGCFLIGFLNQDVLEFIKNIFIDKNLTFITVFILIVAILELIYMFFCGLLGILIGHLSNRSRNLKSFAVGIGLYFMIQIIILGIVYAIGIINKDLNSIFTTFNYQMADIYPLKLLVVLVSIIYLLFLIIMYFTGKKIFRKVDVD